MAAKKPPTPVKVTPKKPTGPKIPTLGYYAARGETKPRMPGTSDFLAPTNANYTFYAGGEKARGTVPYGTRPGQVQKYALPTTVQEFAGTLRADAMRGKTPYEQQWAQYAMNASGIVGRPLYTAGGATAMSIYTMDPKYRQQVKQQLAAAGYKDISNNPHVDDATEKAWNHLLAFANSLGVTWEVAAGMRAGAGYAAETAAKGGGGGGGGGRASQARTWTTVSTDAVLSGRDEAYKVLNAAAQALLGRDARDADINPFLARLQSAQRANPRKTTTTQSTNAEGLLVSSTSSVEESNVLPDVQAEGEVKSVDENEMKAYRRAGYTQVMERLFGGRG
jgi:hypothetical protein